MQEEARAQAGVEHLVAVARDDREHVGQAPVVLERRLGRNCALGERVALRVHVADLDAGERAQRGRGRERQAGVVGVQVRPHELAVGDDDEAVAERREQQLELLARQGALDQEAGAVARSRVIGGDGVVRVLPERRGLGDRLAAQRGEGAAHELHEPGAARVDDAGRTCSDGQAGRRERR